MTPPGAADLRGAPPVVVAARRTPIGTAGHGLAGVGAADLAAPVLARLVEDAGADAGPPTEVVLGNCTGPGGDLARVASLAAGLAVTVPALTVDRQCGSGLAALEVGAALLRTRGGLVLAGGVESASTAPWRYAAPPPGGLTDAPGPRLARAPFAPTALGDPEMGEAADRLAERAGVSRVRQDAYAARSHARAVEARDRGAFDAELVPVGRLRQDERPRAGLDAARLGRLPAAFSAGGTATAGNSCGVNDGAAAVSLVDEATSRAAGLPGLRVLATASSGCDPRSPGLGLVAAVRSALAASGLALGDIDAVELNEAFAGQVLACCDELGLDEHLVCPDGGALALGHPWGASGAVLVVRLFSRLVRGEAGETGLAAIAAGGGQGVAVVVQRCR